MKRLIAVILVLAASIAGAATFSAWDGKTIGRTPGNMARYDGKVFGNASTGRIKLVNSFRCLSTAVGGGGGGGTVLVGDSSVTATSEFTVDNNMLVLRPDSSGWEVGVAASASGKLTKGYARIKYTSSGSSLKMVVASATGTIIEVSDPVTITSYTSLSDVEFNFDGTYDIVSSTRYYLGVIGNGGYVVGTDGVAWTGVYHSSNNYTTPTSFDNNNDLNGDSSFGRIKIWVTN